MCYLLSVAPGVVTTRLELWPVKLVTTEKAVRLPCYNEKKALLWWCRCFAELHGIHAARLARCISFRAVQLHVILSQISQNRQLISVRNAGLTLA